VELVYEGEQEGAQNVAMALLSKALKDTFLAHFPNPEKPRKSSQRDPYGTIKAYFSGGNTTELLNDMSESEYRKSLEKVAGLRKFVADANISDKDAPIFMELVLHGLAEFAVLSKDMLNNKGMTLLDPLAGALDFDGKDN
jgi:magnesium chelatase subunit I